MKFDLPAKEVNIVEGKWVQVPLQRFTDLMNYVEGLEDEVVDLKVNLRESERVGKEMEDLPVMVEQGPAREFDRVEKTLRTLDPDSLMKQLKEKKLSIRKLAMMTGIPYATLYRFLNRQCGPNFKTLKALEKVAYGMSTQPTEPAKVFRRS